MEPDRWKKIETIVAAALELETAERELYVSEACASDHELRAEVDGLLAGENAASGFLEDVKRLVPGSYSGPKPAMTDPLIGSKIGHYLIEGLIGAGGMGTVYLVSRADEEYRQHAALKLLHLGMANPNLLQRFRNERQILAVLEHPNIARLLDGGTTAAGLPYLVMEHIDGVPLDRYCDEHVLDCRERVELFLQVCDAVAFAHRSLVVHRDLKPGNILVTGDGVPKLLDFGIAKLLDSGSVPGDEGLTRTGLRPMSPGYASPEQIRGRPITTGSDVYSLGVVLYRLLTGKLPRDFDGLTPVALERGLSREPTAPSTTVGKESRGGLVSARSLRGDLDAILLKSLREEPEQRYSSVDDLAEDLRRHLAGLPVGARKGSFGYRAGRFLHRHTGMVVMSLLVAVLAGGSTISLVQQNRRISYQRDRAEAMATFSSGLLTVDQVLWTLDNERPVQLLLWKNLQDAKHRLSDDPLLRSDQLMLLARGFVALGQLLESEKYAARALDLRRDASGPKASDDRPLINDLAAIYTATGRYDAAASILTQTLDRGDPRTDAENLEIARSHTLLALCKWSQLRLAESKEHIEAALEITRTIFGDDSFQIAELSMVLGVLEVTRDPGSERAVAFFEAAIESFEADSEKSLMEWPTIRALAETHRSRGEFSRAIKAYDKGFAIASGARGWNYPDLILSLGSLHLTRGEFASASRYLGTGINISTDSGWQILLLSASARLRLDLGDLANAELDCDLLSLLIRRLQRLEGAGEYLEFRQENLQLLALIDLRGGKFKRAKKRITEFLQIIESEAYKRQWAKQSTVVGAEVLFALGDIKQAEVLLRQTIALREIGPDRWNLELVRAFQMLAEISLRSGATADARSLVELSREMIDRQRAIDPSPRINEQLAEVHLLEGDLFHQGGDLVSAHAEWREALRYLSLNPEGTIGADHHLIAGKTWLRLGDETQVREQARFLYDQGWRWPEWVLLGNG